MKKLLIALLFASSVPAFAFDAPPAVFIVDNNAAFPSHVLVNGLIPTTQVTGTKPFPWQIVRSLCSGSLKNCVATVIVDKPNQEVVAGHFVLNAKNGSISVIDVSNGYQITGVRGFGYTEATLSHS